MVVIDFYGIVFANIHANPQFIISKEEGLLRHLILNSLRVYNVKYRKEYGEMYIACDRGSWRKSYFPEYKANRAAAREKSDFDWAWIGDTIRKIKDEINEFLPWHVIEYSGCEADDIIACLVKACNEFGNAEPVMIVSNDKDFLQLHRYRNVKQFSPLKNKLITHPNPREYMIEHVLGGDTGDGVPNILSDDDTFINAEKRQKPLTAKKLQLFKDNYDRLETVLTADQLRNFQRNNKVINLDSIPSEIVSEVHKIIERERSTKKSNNKVMNYLMKNRCANLLDCINDFFVGV